MGRVRLDTSQGKGPSQLAASAGSSRRLQGAPWHLHLWPGRLGRCCMWCACDSHMPVGYAGGGGCSCMWCDSPRPGGYAIGGCICMVDPLTGAHRNPRCWSSAAQGWSAVGRSWSWQGSQGRCKGRPDTPSPCRSLHSYLSCHACRPGSGRCRRRHSRAGSPCSARIYTPQRSSPAHTRPRHSLAGSLFPTGAVLPGC